MTADELLTLLMERVELAESREGGLDGYDPLPHTWHVPLPFRSDARYAGFLQKETQGKLADMCGNATDNLADHRDW